MSREREIHGNQSYAHPYSGKEDLGWHESWEKLVLGGALRRRKGRVCHDERNPLAPIKLRG